MAKWKAVQCVVHGDKRRSRKHVVCVQDIIGVCMYDVPGGMQHMCIYRKNKSK